MKTLTEILDKVEADTRTVLDSPNPPVEDIEPEDLDAYNLPDSSGDKWYRLDDVVVVFADLKNSTQLAVGKHPRTTAGIYRVATGNVVRVLNNLEADFIQIQGDGVFGLFWGDKRLERAICAGITVKTFSEKVLQKKLESKWPNAPETGFKVGVAAGRVLVKNIGTFRDVDEQEPIWAGKPVNYAAKAAQQADRNELIVTGTVWLGIEGNDYLTVSCGCASSGSSSSMAVLWKDVEVDKLGHDEDDAAGRLLEACWCANCGPDFMQAILDGKTERDQTENVTKSLALSETFEASRLDKMRDNIARKRGLSRVKKRR